MEGIRDEERSIPRHCVLGAQLTKCRVDRVSATIRPPCLSPAAACSASLSFTIAIQPVAGACLFAGLLAAGATDTHAQWPQFRGPNGSGIALGAKLSRCVLAVLQCHLESRGALRAVVSRDRGRTRVLTASEGERS